MLRRCAIVALLLVLLSLASCQRDPPIEDDGPIGSFTLTERNGFTVRDSDLHGKVWIASFVFTRCTGPCPQVSLSVMRLQDELKNDPDVRFVTFTVDPKHDGPEELAQYAKSFHADPKRWLFVTGDKEEIYRLLREGFHVPVEENEGDARKPGAEVMHSPKLVVVDRRGHIRGYFDGVCDPRDKEPDQEYENTMRRVRQTVAVLLREGS